MEGDFAMIHWLRLLEWIIGIAAIFAIWYPSSISKQ